MSQAESGEAQLLLRKAQEDADAVAKLAADDDTADAIVGFHAQQAVEKALKAVLAAAGDDFPWTHDLRYLIERLDDLETPLPASLHEVRVLSPWAVEFRYGETIDDPLDREAAVTLANQAIDWPRPESQRCRPGESLRETAHYARRINASQSRNRSPATPRSATKLA